MQLLRQQIELIGAEGVELEFEDEAIREIARMAALLNKTVENIGARRLHTVLERIMETISFEAAEMEKGTVRDFEIRFTLAIYTVLFRTMTHPLCVLAEGNGEQSRRRGAPKERYNEGRRVAIHLVNKLKVLIFHSWSTNFIEGDHYNLFFKCFFPSPDTSTAQNMYGSCRIKIGRCKV